MQSAYWYARRLQPKIRFRRRVVLEHVLLSVGVGGYRNSWGWP